MKTETEITCAYCKEEILPHERMEPMSGDEVQMHRECWLRLIMGSIKNQRGKCFCDDGADCDDPELTRRENAACAAAFFFNRARQSETLTCPRCGGALGTGQALQNTASVGTLDFSDSADLVGQTVSFSGEAKLIEVEKCRRCGYSRK